MRYEFRCNLCELESEHIMLASEIQDFHPVCDVCGKPLQRMYSIPLINIVSVATPAIRDMKSRYKQENDSELIEVGTEKLSSIKPKQQDYSLNDHEQHRMQEILSGSNT